MGPISPVPKPKRDQRDHHGEAALWVLTDWQGAKVTTSYNSAVMEERVHRYCDTAEKITNMQHADHPVRECVVAFGGKSSACSTFRRSPSRSTRPSSASTSR